MQQTLGHELGRMLGVDQPTLVNGHIAPMTVAVDQRIFVPSSLVGAYTAPADHLFHAGSNSQATLSPSSQKTIIAVKEN